MASQNPPTAHKKLTENESKLRQAESQRKERQWYIDTAVRFKIYRARFMNLLNTFTKRLPETDPHISQLSSTLAQEIDAWSDLETLLLDIPAVATVKPVRLPDTGDIQLIPEHSDEQTMSPHEEIDKLHAIHELVLDCQRCIREFYHAQHHMPNSIKMGALNYFSLTPLCKKCSSDKYFPQTRVLVQLDLSLGDQMICE